MSNPFQNDPLLVPRSDMANLRNQLLQSPDARDRVILKLVEAVMRAESAMKIQSEDANRLRKQMEQLKPDSDMSALITFTAVAQDLRAIETHLRNGQRITIAETIEALEQHPDIRSRGR